MTADIADEKSQDSDGTIVASCFKEGHTDYGVMIEEYVR